MDWLTPFTVLCGVAVVVGYALLGATWLVWRTEGALQRRCRALTRACSGWPIARADRRRQPVDADAQPGFLHRWFGWPGILLTSPVPILVALLAVAVRRGLARKHHLTPFLCALGWFVLCFAGLGISIFPLMVPPDITIWQAAAPPAASFSCWSARRC